MSKKGYKSGYNGPDFDSIPKGERFNPYDYIDFTDYRNTANGQKAYAEDLAQLQYLADLQMQDWQNAYNEAQLADAREYDSPANQVALMRQAGLNPDLLGVSGGSSTPLSSSGGPSASSLPNPIQGIPTNLDKAGSIISIIGSVANIAASMYTGGLSSVGATLSNASAGVSLIDNIINSSDNFAGSDVNSIISSLPLSRGQRKKLDKIHKSVFGSPRSESSNNRFWTKYKVDNAEFMKSLISPFLNPSDHDGNGIIDADDWSYVWQPLFEAQFDIMEKELSSRSTDLSLDQKRYSKEESDLDYMNALKEPFRDVISRIKKKYDDGNEFWGYALSVLYAILSNSFSFSSSSSSNQYGEKSSLSFGIK